MVVGWLLRVVLLVAVIALIVFNAVMVVAGRVGAEQDANNAAVAAASAYKEQGTLAAAFAAAQGSVGTSTERVLRGSIRIMSDGDVTLELRRRLQTLVMADIPWLARFTVVTVRGTGAPAALS